MIVYVAYLRDAPWLMRVFSTRTLAAAFVNAHTWPRQYVVHKRTVHDR